LVTGASNAVGFCVPIMVDIVMCLMLAMKEKVITSYYDSIPSNSGFVLQDDGQHELVGISKMYFLVYKR